MAPTTVALSIEDKEMERLAAEVAALAGESVQGAIRQSLRERRERLAARSGGRRELKGGLLHYLATELWPQVPDELLDRQPLTKAEKEKLLGYGPEGC